MVQDWQRYQNILCIRLDNMGDVLMTVPAIRALKQSVPGRNITLLTSKAGSLVAPMIPEVDSVITFDVPWVKTTSQASTEQIVELSDIVRRGNFDAAIIHTVYSQNPMPTAMLCYLAGIPQVLAYCRENPYGLIPDWIPDPEPLDVIRHEVERQLELVGTIGAQTDDTKLSLHIPDTATAAARQLLARHGVDKAGCWLVLHPGVSEDKRRYPAEAFIAACRRLIEEDGCQIVITGSADEHEYASDIQRALGPKAYNLAGACSVAELAALIAEAPLLVSNNTGPVHISAAVRTPVVVLYAMTNPQHTPWQVPHRVLYFEVPSHLRSKNKFLESFPGTQEPKASPDAIVRAVRELQGGGGA